MTATVVHRMNVNCQPRSVYIVPAVRNTSSTPRFPEALWKPMLCCNLAPAYVLDTVAIPMGWKKLLPILRTTTDASIVVNPVE